MHQDYYLLSALLSDTIMFVTELCEGLKTHCLKVLSLPPFVDAWLTSESEISTFLGGTGGRVGKPDGIFVFVRIDVRLMFLFWYFGICLLAVGRGVECTLAEMSSAISLSTCNKSGYD